MTTHDPPIPLDSQPSTQPTSSLAPGARIGPYRILELLGEGGMGSVYLAEQGAPLRRRVALKIVKLGMDSQQLLLRFEAERQTLAILDHPNIAKVFNAGITPEGRPFFVMEHVAGVPITDYCDTNRLDTRERLSLFIQVCDAIQHAHQKGIIHRDVKPTNVLVHSRDGGPHAKVIDFGVARATNQRLTERTLYTERGQLVGTPEYMSPEQAGLTQLDIDTRTDIYSLGVLLYKLLVGHLPFDFRRLREAGYLEMTRIIREEDPPRPSTRVGTLGSATAEVARRRRTDAESLQKQLRGDLDWILMRTLEKDRTRRYDAVSELAEEIRRHLRDEPVLAGPPGIGYRARKLLRRHRAAVAGTLAGLAMLAGGLVVSTSLYLRAEAARQESERQRAKAEWESYLGNLRAADASLLEGRIAEARRRLATCPPRLRNWEWSHLHRRSDSSEVTLRPGGAIAAARLCREGVRIGLSSGHLLTWDGGGFREAPLGENRGGRLAGVDRSGSVGVVAIETSNTGGGRTCQLRLVDLSSGVARPGVSWNDACPARGVLAPGLDRFAFVVQGHASDDVVIWDTPSGRIAKAPGAAAGRMELVAFGGKRVALRIRGGLVVRSAATGRDSFALRGGRAAAFTADEERVVTGLEDGTLQIRSASSGDVLVRFSGHRSAVTAVDLSPDGRQVASGSSAGEIRIWSADSGAALATLNGHGSAILDVAFSTDGTRLVSYPYRDEVRVWSVSRGAGDSLLAQDVRLFALSRDGQRIVVAGDNGVLRVLDSATGEEMQSFVLAGGRVIDVGFGPDGQWIYCASEDGTIRLWQIPSGKELQTLIHPHGGAVAVSPDGLRIASGSLGVKHDGIIRVWDRTTGEKLADLAHAAGAVALAFSPDGRWLASGSMLGKTVRLWDATSYSLVGVLPTEGMEVSAIRFDADGSHLLVATFGAALMWDVESRTLAGLLDAGRGATLDAAWSPDGSRIVTTPELRIWDHRRFELLLTVAEKVFAPTFSPDGRRLFAIRVEDHALVAWDTRSAYDPEVESLVDSLFDELVLSREVVARLDAMRGLPAPQHAAALRSVGCRRDDPELIAAGLGWKVFYPGWPEEALRRALRRAEAAAELEPDNPWFRQTVGLAEYRLGRYLEAEATLEQVVEAHADRPAAVAGLAMSQARLGRKDDARRTLSSLKAAEIGPGQIADLVAEAEAVLRGEPPL